MTVLCVVSVALGAAALGALRLASTRTRLDEVTTQIEQLRREVSRLAAARPGATTTETDKIMNYLLTEVADLRVAVEDEAAAAPQRSEHRVATTVSAAPAETAQSVKQAPEPNALRQLKSRIVVTPTDWQDIDASVVAMSREENREFWHQFGEAIAHGDIQLFNPQEPESGKTP